MLSSFLLGALSHARQRSLLYDRAQSWQQPGHGALGALHDVYATWWMCHVKGETWQQFSSYSRTKPGKKLTTAANSPVQMHDRLTALH